MVKLLLEGTGSDWFIANAGDDIIVGGAGSDVIDGGLGVDELDYSADAASGGIAVETLDFEASYGRTSMEYYDGFVPSVLKTASLNVTVSSEFAPLMVVLVITTSMAALVRVTLFLFISRARALLLIFMGVQKWPTVGV